MSAMDAEDASSNCVRCVATPVSRRTLACADDLESWAVALKTECEYINQYGLSHAAIFNAVDASLQHLEMPYIDLCALPELTILHTKSFKFCFSFPNRVKSAKVGFQFVTEEVEVGAPCGLDRIQ